MVSLVITYDSSILILPQYCFLSSQTQKVAVPVPTGPVWGGSTVRSPSLAEIQEEEYRLRLQQPQAPSRGSSFQLKSLLGLSSSSSFSPNAPVESSAWEAPAAARPAVTPSPSLKEILRQEEAKHVEETELKQQQSQLLMQQQIRAARESAAAESATALVIANSSWSGSAVGDAAARKSKTAKAAPSLRDIMQLEEASSAALQSQVASPDSPFASAPRPAPGSWAAKASSLSGGPTPMSAARPTPHTASNSNAIAVNGSKKSAASIVSPPAVVPMPSKPQPAGPSFGGGRSGFSADLSEWCVAQLAKIRAADSDSNADPTEFFGVLEYCATLQSAVEVRETFSAYLGSTILVCHTLRILLH